MSKAFDKLSKKNRWTFLWIVIVTIVTIIINLCIGSSNTNIFELLQNLIFNQDTSQTLVLLNLRLPHVLCSLIAGAALGICGCLLQSTLGNPLASPSTIGISQGASCGACIAIVFGSELFLSTYSIALFAFIFALIPTLLIFVISKFTNLSKTSIILTGVALSIFFSGIIALVEYFADSSKVSEVIFWTFGSVYNADFTKLLLMFIVLVFAITYAMLNFLKLNAMECGDITAHSIGISVKKIRLINLVVSAFVAATITAFCGTINFIGLISPHIMKKFVSSNYKYLLPASAFCGAILLSLSDIVSACILPGLILPIGAITSFIGAPIFIWIIIRKK